MPLNLPQLSIEEIDQIDGAIALFPCGELSESLQLFTDEIVIAVAAQR